MAVVPTMMVLYSNDAVDVRYSDGSLLQLSPCGSSMFHQDPPTDMPRHPLAGVQGVKKWTQFVTSAHKAKVLLAVDFRNRFACRPFLCPSLMPPEDIVSLYARIDQIAWGRTGEDSHLQVFEDGSRRAVSRDEYASLVLSPHGQDFTVCYLSRISPDSVTTTSSGPQTLPQQDHGVSVLADPGILSHPFPKAGGSHSEDKSLVQTVSDNAGATCRKSSLPCDEASNRQNDNSTPVNEAPTSGDVTLDASGLILSEGGTLSTPGRSAQAVDAQSSVFSVQHDISSISRVSTPDGLRGMVEECDDTLPLAEDIAVTSSPLAAEVLHSSPLNLVNTVSCTGKGDNSREAVGGLELNDALKESEATVQKPAGSSTGQAERGTPARRDGENAVSGSGEVREEGKDACSTSTTSCARTEPTGPPASSSSSSSVRTIPEQAGESSTHGSQITHPSRTCREEEKKRSSSSSSRGSGGEKVYSGEARDHRSSSSSRGGGGDKVYSGEGSSQDSGSGGVGGSVGGVGVGGHSSQQVWTGGGRQHYSWVTQHISCNSCPPAWRHPLRLLQQTDPTTSILASECNLTVSSNIAKGLRHINAADASKCVMTSVTSPLSLTCPFQHLHQWQSPHDGGEDDGGLSAESISPFKQGQLKVLMMEGVVYRFVDVANMKVVEIYPGDGSVLISQGATARFFSHLIWKDGKLEEKSYSVKMLPPKPPSAPYSVQHLINRAHRLLTGCIHNSPLSEREALPCWKQAVTHVVEPLSSSLLEECSVTSYGRFTAYSNGRVRVLFEDRTALDMVADFSRRLQDCVKHSSDDSQVSMEEKLAALKLTSGNSQQRNCQCRLLLPSGKYVMAELLKPGPYRRYVDAAKEWVQWVQSSPKERRQFYQEKTTPHSARRSAEAELKKIECFNYIVDHSAIPTSAANNTSHPSASTTSLSQPPPPPTHFSAYSSTGRPLSHVAPLSVPQRSTNLQPAAAASQHGSGFGHREGAAEVSSKSGFLPSDPKDVAMLQGFHSVREALLRTSQMIREIDDIVKDQKESGSAHSHDNGTPEWNV